MSHELISFLREVIEADGKIDEREEMAIEKVQAVFADVASIHFKDMAAKGVGTVTGAAKCGVYTLTGAAQGISRLRTKRGTSINKE